MSQLQNQPTASCMTTVCQKEDATSRWTAQPADEEHNQLTNDTRVDGVTESFIH